MKEGSSASHIVSRVKAELLENVFLLSLHHSFSGIEHNHNEQMLHRVILETNFDTASDE
jgi:hypothetical protein